MKARGLRQAVTNVNVQLPDRPLTRAAVKRQPLQSRNERPAPAEARQKAKQCMEVDLPSETKPPLARDSTGIEALYRMVGDVDSDECDRKKAELVSCYVKEIFSYLVSLESSQPIAQDFLCQPAKLEITPKMRKILFDWLIEVHQRFTLLPETLYLCFHMIDYYMCVRGGEMKKSNYQLVGVTALLLASKYEEVYPPEISDLVYLTDGTYSESEIRRMERQLLTSLEFFVGYPLEIQFLRRYSKVSGATTSEHELAKYLTELSRSAYELAHLPPSQLSAACFCLARELLLVGDSNDAWAPALEVFSGYAKEELTTAMGCVARQVLLMQTEQRHTAVKRKYASRSFSSISAISLLADAANPVLQRHATSA